MISIRAFGGLGAEEVEHLPDLLVQIARLELQPPDLGEVEKVVQQILQPLALALDKLDLRQRPAVARGTRCRESPRPAAPCSAGSSRADS